MRLIILGARGMLGHDLVAAAAARGVEAFGYDLPELDITKDAPAFGSLPTADWVVNCAAFTDVDGAESAKERAFAVNSGGAGRVARWCAGRGIPLLHISTDYVFDGRNSQPYRESDTPRPINAYGASKLDGERAVQSACPNALIVRTQSLFGRHGRNFVQAILSRLESGSQPLRVVNDQTSCPTYTVHLADALLRLLAADRRGTVHVSASGACTWYEFAVAIVNRLAPGREVQPVTSREYARPARRPAYSVLDKDRYATWTGHTMPSWSQGLDEYLLAVQQTKTQGTTR
jgi:dTDP-4-dehydrorhamnose reductase